MVIRPAIPNGYSLVAPLKTSARRRMSGASIGVLTVVAAAHVGLAVYLYGAHFSVSRPAERPDPAPFIITLPRWKPAPQQKQDHQVQKRTVPIHLEQQPKIETQKTIEVKPQPQTQPLVDNGPQLLPTVDTGPAPEPTKPHVITDPRWARQPSSDELADVYPERALGLGKAGLVELSCTVAASGDLSGCRVAREDPQGWGFGSAAMKLTKRFRLVPRQLDGKPVDGALVNIPIRFSVAPG